MSFETPRKKLPKPERREQLLESAMTIARHEGADALTLGHLAVRAGVSKPVVYEHFGTRSGLLIALYQRIDARQVLALTDALNKAPRRLKDVAWVVATAYIDCFATVGPEWHAIAAALKGNEEMDAVLQGLVDGYVAIYQDALQPFSKLAPHTLHVRCVGIFGAADALSKDMIFGRLDASTATENLAAMIVRSIR